MSTSRPSAVPSPSGFELFRDFLRTRKVTCEAAADALGVSKTAVLYWIHEEQRPRETARRAIALWTTGAVPAESWETEEDRRRVAAVQPFAPASSSEPEAA